MANLTEDIRSDLTKIFSERNEVVAEDNKLTVNIQSFIEWFFSERDDYIDFAVGIVNSLNKGEPVIITPESLFNSAQYVPGWIVNGGDHDKEYSPSELTLVSD